MNRSTFLPAVAVVLVAAVAACGGDAVEPGADAAVAEATVRSGVVPSATLASVADAVTERQLVHETRLLPFATSHSVLGSIAYGGRFLVIYRQFGSSTTERLAVLARDGSPVDPAGTDLSLAPHQPQAMSLAVAGANLAVAYAYGGHAYLRLLGPDLQWLGPAIVTPSVNDSALGVEVLTAGDRVWLAQWGFSSSLSISSLTLDGIPVTEPVEVARLDARRPAMTMAFGGGRLVAAWTDASGQGRIARIAIDGTVMDPGGWPLPGAPSAMVAVASGFVVAAAQLVRVSHDMVVDPAGIDFPGTPVAIVDGRLVVKEWDEFGRYVLSDVDAAGAVRVIGTMPRGYDPIEVVGDGNEVVAVVDHDNRKSLVHLTRDGGPGGGLRPLRMRQAGERILQAAADANGYLLAWSTETEVASRQLFMARLDRDGGVVGAPRQLDGDPGELVTRPGGFWQRSGGSVQALDASGAPVGDWQDYTMQRFAMRGDVALGVHSESNVAYGQRFTVGGAVDASRVPLATGVDSANGQLAVAGGDGGWLVAWCEGGTIVFERVGVDGRPLDAPARTASIAPSVCEAPPTIVFAGGAFHLFWVSAIRSTTDRIWSMRITGAGTASAPALVARREWSGGTVAAAVVGSSIAVLAHDGYIVLARVGLDGTPVAGQFDGDARDAWLLPASGGRALLLEAVDHDIGGDLRPRIFRRFLTPVAAGACDIGFECASGVCADGVCCDRTCGAGAGDCQACSVAAGAARDGVCGVVATGIECRASDGACGAAEVCDGVATACPADTGADDGATCDDGVVCTSGDVCTAGVCAGRAVECPTSECTVAACDFSTGACVTTQVPPGTPCTGGFCHGGQCQVADAGVPDAGMPDAGVPDAGLAPDARPPTVPTRPTTDDDGGCGCRSGRPDGSVAALLLALGFLARRRRGRAAA